MNIAEECLSCLHTKDWMRLNKILSDNSNCNDLAYDPIFNIFENNLVDEIKRYEEEGDTEVFAVLARLFQLHQGTNSTLKFSENGLLKIAEYLFDKHPAVPYAQVLKNNLDAQIFLQKHNKDIISQIETTKISANLNIKIGETGKLLFQKEIFNSPQEKELYLAALNSLNDVILLPNAALSTIIDSKVCTLLHSEVSSFFFKSTIDLCIVDKNTYKPIFFIELDSSWHDLERNRNNDEKKDQIFKTAGLKLHRLRKKENKSMVEIFELFLNKYYES